MTLRAELDALLGAAAREFEGTPQAVEIGELRARLDGPLRVAVAGRVKAGKSTLLNALLGERLAATDAGECTRVVTWYSYGEGYDVSCELQSGERRPLQFTRDDGRLQVQLDGDIAAVRRIAVEWPSARLRRMTLIDTPGIGSLTPGISARTEEALVGRQSPGEADAVIYLMRHAHASDARFLEAFLDRQAADITPVNSVAVLSRADEIGGGRLDSLESARRIAARYAADHRIRTLASSVVAVAGLLAETGATLEEREAESLRVLAREPQPCDEMLLSVDHFRAPDLGPLTLENRELLLARFGLYGIRFAVKALREGQWQTGTDLARLLIKESGIAELAQVVGQRFGSRSRRMVARAVLESLRALTETLTEHPGAAGILRWIEQLEASAHEIAELRMLHLVWSGAAAFSDEERIEAERVTGDGTAAERAGYPAGTSDEVRAAAVAGVMRWRERAAGALIDRQTATCSETIARSYEGIYAAAGESERPPSYVSG